MTGASGYLGKQVVRRLANAGGRVHVLVRKTSNLKALAHRNIHIFYGDLQDKESIRAAMKECQRVYHIGALVARWHPDSRQFDRTNVAGSQNVFEAALDLKADKLVYTSSVMALGSSGETPADETHPRSGRFVNDYERTKYQAEIKFKEMVDRGLPGVMVSPSLIFGPSINYPGSLTNRLIKQFIEGKLKALPNAGAKKANGVFIEDVVTGHFLAMDKGKVGEKYILGGENLTLDQFIALMNSEFKLNRVLKKIPLPVFWMAGWFEEFKAGLRKTIPEISRSSAKVYTRHWAYSSEKAKKELGYNPRSLREGLKITYAWLTGQPLAPPAPSGLVGPNYIPITLK